MLQLLLLSAQLIIIHPVGWVDMQLMNRDRGGGGGRRGGAVDTKRDSEAFVPFAI